MGPCIVLVLVVYVYMHVLYGVLRSAITTIM